MIPPPLALLSLLLLASESLQPRNKAKVDSDIDVSDGTTAPQSRWRHRTAKRRERTEHLLNRIEASKVIPPPLLNTTCQRLGDDDIPTLLNPPIDWDQIDHELDPIRGGKIRPDTPRGARKRAQVEAFAYVVSELLKKNKSASGKRSSGTTIIDAGSGAGNLAIPLAGVLDIEGFSDEFDILAVDVNEFALQRLADRAKVGMLADKVRTLVADLADTDAIMSGGHVSSDQDVIIVSLHACGAASDYAMELAYNRGAPFAICPCCTAKSLTKREDSKNGDKEKQQLKTDYHMNASFKRSGSTKDITYPRSKWLSDIITSLDSHAENQYEILAKVADVGLGPQTPAQQREHQRRAKKIVELDRLASSAENHDYETRLLRIQHHYPHEYGKGELLLGARRGSIAAEVFGNLLTS